MTQIQKDQLMNVLEMNAVLCRGAHAAVTSPKGGDISATVLTFLEDSCRLHGDGADLVTLMAALAEVSVSA